MNFIDHIIHPDAHGTGPSLEVEPVKARLRAIKEILPRITDEEARYCALWAEHMATGPLVAMGLVMSLNLFCADFRRGKNGWVGDAPFGGSLRGLPPIVISLFEVSLREEVLPAVLPSEFYEAVEKELKAIDAEVAKAQPGLPSDLGDLLAKLKGL